MGRVVSIVARRRVKLTRASFTPSMVFSVFSIDEIHTAQCTVGTFSKICPAIWSVSARFCAMGAALQAGQAEMGACVIINRLYSETHKSNRCSKVTPDSDCAVTLTIQTPG